MVYPLNKEAFMQLWQEAYNNPDAGDLALGKAIVEVVSNAYKRGFDDGKEAAECRK